MSVFRKYKGKRITSKDKNWSKGRWYVWRRIKGKIIHKSIPEAQTKEQAEIAERKIIEDVFNKKYGNDTTKFGEFVDRVYRKYVEQNNISLGTKRIYIRYLLDRFGHLALSDIGPQDCRNAQMGFRKRYSASTVNQLMSTASKIFTLACQENILDRNPMQFVTRLKEPPPRNRLLTKEEKERLWIELEKDELMFRLVTLAINIPSRRGQLLAIIPTVVDLPNGTLFISSSKGRAPRLVPLNSAASSTLALMLRDGQLPFPLKETGIRKRWVKILKRAKIENFRLHDLRTEFGSNLIKQNVNREIVNKLFAHSSMKVTQVYMSAEMEQLKAAVNTLDEVSEVEGVQ